MVYDDTPDLDAPAGWRIGRGRRLVEGAMKTERARRLRVVAVGPLALGLRKRASRRPLLDEDGLVERNGRVVVPFVSRILFRKIVLARTVWIVSLNHAEVFRGHGLCVAQGQSMGRERLICNIAPHVNEGKATVLTDRLLDFRRG